MKQIELGDEHWALYSISTHQNFDELVDLYKGIVQETGFSEQQQWTNMNMPI